MRYVAVRDCFYQGMYYKKGQWAEIKDKAKAPEWFKPEKLQGDAVPLTPGLKRPETGLPGEMP